MVPLLQVRPLQVNRSVVLSFLSTLCSPLVDLFLTDSHAVRKLVVFPLVIVLPFLEFHSLARPLLCSHVGIFLSDCAVPRLVQVVLDVLLLVGLSVQEINSAVLSFLSLILVVLFLVDFAVEYLVVVALLNICPVRRIH